MAERKVDTAARKIDLTSWNQAAIRFIDPPCFTWTPVEGAATYQIGWESGDTVGWETAKEPRLDFAPLWSKIGQGRISWVIAALNDKGEPIARSAKKRFERVPDFDGKDEAPLDWKAAARKNLDFILSLPKDERSGEPHFIAQAWHDLKPNSGRVNFPALHYPSFVFLFLEALKHEKDTARIEAALESLITAILRDRTPNQGVAPGMPMTTRILHDPGNKFQPWSEKNAITLFRSARMGEALLALYEWKKEARLLEYADHIASTLAKLQREDGSWPYRINPDSGKVVEDYTSAGICIVVFLDRLMRVAQHDRYKDAVTRAVQWTLDNPCKTNRWQGMYEDVSVPKPFSNLENWDTLEAITYFAKDRTDLAKKLNRYVEDQFVIFGPAKVPAGAKAHTPVVLEQYVCYWPMEVHTAHWIESLLALHAATGDDSFMRKARRAANAIVRAQFPDGRLSTWGVDAQTGKPINNADDWYGCNAVAAWMLYRMSR